MSHDNILLPTSPETTFDVHDWRDGKLQDWIKNTVMKVQQGHYNDNDTTEAFSFELHEEREIMLKLLIMCYGIKTGHANFLQNYSKKEKEPVRAMLEKIKKECRKLDKIEFNIFYVSVGIKEKATSSETKGEFGNLEIPLLQLSKSKKVLDLSDPGTIYQSFQRYLENNKLERSVIVYPEKATYAQQQVQLKVCESPSCTLTSDIANVANVVLKFASVAAMFWTPGCLLAGRALATMSTRIFTQGSFWAVALLRASAAVNSATKYARAITTITSLFGSAFAGM
ncbi:unnamed protein product, partial [Mesorhabditis belari]|uniref:DUF4781 domain-containing protein n=1 Tax=Mesorhabditis belari TaxID=2138241 RepID=A0AAF3EWF6_9BILA